MRKPIFLLFLLMIGCAPAPTIKPTLTDIPATASFTPRPTETLEPTPTPVGFQVSNNGVVQIFENGKYVDLKAPEGNWGEVEGLKVVVEKDAQGNEIAVAQMMLEGGFVDIEGDNLIDVAIYNREIKAWDLKHDIIVARSIENWKVLPANVYQLTELQGGGVLATMAVVGYKFETSGGVTSLNLLTFYKNRIIELDINELLFSEFEREVSGGYVTTRTLSDKLVEAEKLSIFDVISLLGISRNMTPENLSDFHVFAVWDILPSETRMANCDSRGALPLLEGFKNWCKAEIGKGEGRYIPSRADIEQLLLFGKGNVSVDEANKLENPALLWDLVESSEPVDGTWLSIQIGFLKK